MQPYPAMLYLLRPNEMKLEKKGWWSGLLNPSFPFPPLKSGRRLQQSVTFVEIYLSFAEDGERFSVSDADDSCLRICGHPIHIRSHTSPLSPPFEMCVLSRRKIDSLIRDIGRRFLPSVGSGSGNLSTIATPSFKVQTGIRNSGPFSLCVCVVSIRYRCLDLETGPRILFRPSSPPLPLPARKRGSGASQWHARSPLP
ncbi:uncharacterized protein BDZ83DRAFT_733499 [Colletotrichum acutatum]|uniref:Uncharacterized protein n=1 Tax=Glomerella acutata TaxID=27357 RepID=A0AAD8UGF2_GLOAC|nr:uncharacterized protein BDZ83DRAFT_733499 [Colletotrichum acutatum]KAK1718805.1 hypothetical protein BDZ83DRAFT_733499 [Colletotrichum acutatum]